jgi:formamidase
MLHCTVQVYLLLSCCPCEGRLSGIVDVPNAVCTLAIPTAMFDQDVRPKKGGIPVQGVAVKNDVAKSTYDGNLPLTRCLCHSMTGSGSSSAADLSASQVAGAKEAATE